LPCALPAFPAALSRLPMSAPQALRTRHRTVRLAHFGRLRVSPADVRLGSIAPSRTGREVRNAPKAEVILRTGSSTTGHFPQSLVDGTGNNDAASRSRL
jgi:hypothetical protein